MSRRSSLRGKGPARIGSLSIAEHMLAGLPIRTAPDEPQRASYRIVLSPGIWRGVDVTIEPPSSDRPVQHFSDRDAAMAFAEELSRVEGGWKIIDRTEAEL